MAGIPQLVKARKDGKRPGYRGAGGYQGGRSDTPSGAAKAGPVERSGGGDGDNRREQYAVARTITPEQTSALANVPSENQLKTQIALDTLMRQRPEVNIPGLGIMGFVGNMFKKPIQKFADISAAENRGFFADPNYRFNLFGMDLGPKKSVIQAGKYQLPGELGVKYGKLGYEDISEMTSEELEQAYKGYMSARLSGEIDAYGNPLMRGDGDNPLQNLLLAQQQAAIANPLGTEETPQGGVAAYYNQYLKNLGYIL